MPMIVTVVFSLIFRQAISTNNFRTVINYSGSLLCLEHVIVKMSLNVVYGYRRDIKVELTSPSQTVSTLLGHRDLDYSNGGYFEWPFMSVMFWGENPTGEWVLTVSTQSSQTVIDVTDVAFRMYGVSSTVANIPANCHPDCRRGCAQEGSEFCDACVNLRNAHTFECIDTCPPGYTERNGYCYNDYISDKQCVTPLKRKGLSKYIRLLLIAPVSVQVLVLMLAFLDVVLIIVWALPQLKTISAIVMLSVTYMMTVAMT